MASGGRDSRAGAHRTSTASVVVAEVDLSTPPETTFSALTNAELYSRWLQVPVTIEDGEFAATLEWGTEVRGRYEFVIPPHLIVMGWDFDDGNVPIPGRPLTGYLRVHPDGRRQPGRGAPARRHSRSGGVHGSRLGHGPRTSQSQHRGRRRRIGSTPTPTPSQGLAPTRRLMRPTLLRRDSDPERPWTPPGKRRRLDQCRRGNRSTTRRAHWPRRERR